MKSVNLIFPHQLFKDIEALKNGDEVYLIEEYLFFRQYAFHKQKIAFHRATMQAYRQYLMDQGVSVRYIESGQALSDIRNFEAALKTEQIGQISVFDPSDDWLEQRLNDLAKHCKIITRPTPLFINSRDELTPFFRADKKSFFQTSFYKQQRKKRGVLLDEQGQPQGGKWTYDIDNRKKYPKGKIPPAITFPADNDYWEEAVAYTNTHFPNNPGEVSSLRYYPITFEETADWLQQFLTYRFYDFGAYEDAILKDHTFLNHSVLTPMLNVGLILPNEVLERALVFSEEADIPINSTEGFVRQIMGWREFIRGMYVCKGRYSRIQNFWGFKRKIPSSFYDGTTGIYPIDQTIRKILKTGYCHHIERLMVLGNFMLLCEFDPDEVYRWFMELFIDAYDWVMVPNVYGMSLFADGGTFATKPYIAGSNYLRKMSDYPKGDWEAIWDGLFWRFISSHSDFFLANPRLSMMVRTWSKMSVEKQESHLLKAEEFLQNISK